MQTQYKIVDFSIWFLFENWRINEILDCAQRFARWNVIHCQDGRRRNFHSISGVRERPSAFGFHRNESLSYPGRAPEIAIANVRKIRAIV